MEGTVLLSRADGRGSRGGAAGAVEPAQQGRTADGGPPRPVALRPDPKPGAPIPAPSHRQPPGTGVPRSDASLPAELAAAAAPAPGPRSVPSPGDAGAAGAGWGLAWERR